MDPSILFAGIRFDTRRFAGDIEKFKKKENSIDEYDAEKPMENLPGFEITKGDSLDSNTYINKKRKKSYVSSSGESINLFKSSHASLDVDQSSTQDDPMVLQRREQERLLELTNVHRKKHGIHVAGHDIPLPITSFEELKSKYKCKAYLLRNLVGAGYKQPTPIQLQAITVLLGGRECFACAPTGSGKTLAFAIPVLMKLKVPSNEGIRALVLSPTRELAKQITLEMKRLAKGRKFRIRLLTKSLAKCADFSNLPCDILVSTPLRLDSLLGQSKLDLSRVEYLIMDEADKLFELGFVEQIDEVLQACSNPSIVRCLFSATLPDTVEELARNIMNDPVRIIVGEKNSASHSIKQKLVFVGNEEGKLLALRQILKENFHPPMLLFVQNKERARELHRELAFDGIKADTIHADLTQSKRERAVEKFREGKSWVLIATDLMARGMDFKGVNTVVNVDFPNTTAAYIHRIGRSGRAGRSGEAMTLYTEEDVPFLKSILNVMVASGSEVPPWMLSLPKAKRKKHNPQRKPISTNPIVLKEGRREGRHPKSKPKQVEDE